MAHPSTIPFARRSTARATTTVAVVAVVGTALAAGPGGAATPAVSPARDQAMTRQLPQDITVSVRGRTVRVHFGSLRRRATRTATIRFTRPGARSVVRTSPAAGTLRLTAPRGSSRVRVTVPRTQEWTPTSITRAIRR
jgi:hypothetical protein